MIKREESPLIGNDNRIYYTLGLCDKLLLPLRLWRVRRKLSHQIMIGLSATSEEIHNRCLRLDVFAVGALDETKTQLLISWAFDVDLKRSEWDAVFYHLAGPNTALAKREAILAWTDSLLQDHSQRMKREDRGQGSWLKGLVYSWSKSLTQTHGVIDHRGSFARVWAVVKFLAALYMFLSIPYQVTLLREELLGRYFTSLLVSWAFDVVLVMDIIIRFNLSFIDGRSLHVCQRSLDSPYILLLTNEVLYLVFCFLRL